MPTIDDLILEKKRYGLEPTVSIEEKNKLEQGIPIQYIMGYVEFLNTRINLNHKVLIPRYETEEMVYMIIEKYSQISKNIDVLDLCCGSGFIGLAIKKNLKNVNVTLSDIDQRAIEQTKENAQLNFNNHSNIKIVQSDLFEKINTKFDLIVSNPPYLDEDIVLQNQKNLNFEPQHALFAKNQGWYFYDKILNQYKNYLKPNGKLILEINPLHIEKWKTIQNAQIINDINNKPRFVIIV
ncbi:peptide chain release factor N(5)-glutamine methyltransferase [Mycoplasmopsis phocirhinis]|uniref:peptide chain release factor N(5)-glutamine methyltransferase n=1 Tax=Mycoplasmopsis phocirhinis TaxID=142650 RepID=A0A4P6MN20_9BACT|nr:peptide chain release factor N(5)-glutamine methyltransferase [Mycoplasmopsis phocirhinis]QBF34373.1 peptide chain release factor N(5)-glutamine methyltransferase [Mycoplasmopsis phocirhinis]